MGLLESLTASHETMLPRRGKNRRCSVGPGNGRKAQSRKQNATAKVRVIDRPSKEERATTKRAPISHRPGAATAILWHDRGMSGRRAGDPNGRGPATPSSDGTARISQADEVQLSELQRFLGPRFRMTLPCRADPDSVSSKKTSVSGMPPRCAENGPFEAFSRIRILRRVFTTNTEQSCCASQHDLAISALL
jgi:hypothetical protein